MSADYDILRKEIDRLSAEIELLHAHIRKGADLINSGDELSWKYCKLLDRDVKNAFERIVNLELKVFPNLQNDIDEVYKAIGEGDDKANNPLDRRDK
jgi:hypothetical protein